VRRPLRSSLPVILTAASIANAASHTLPLLLFLILSRARNASEPSHALPKLFARHPERVSIATESKDLGQLRVSEAGSGFESAQRSLPFDASPCPRRGRRERSSRRERSQNNLSLTLSLDKERGKRNQIAENEKGGGAGWRPRLDVLSRPLHAAASLHIRAR